MAVSPLKMVRDYFHTEARPMGLKEMREEWTTMPQADKDQILKGLTDGSLTY